MFVSHWLNSLKQVLGGSIIYDPIRKPFKHRHSVSRPMVETLEARLAPSIVPFSGAGYDGTWDTTAQALVVNTAVADGALPGSTLSIATIVDSGNTFLTINGTEISAVLTNEVQTLTVTNTDVSNVTFDISSVSSSDFSYAGFAVTVTGVAAGNDALTVNNTDRTWTINNVNAGTAAGSDYTVTFTNIPNITAGSGADTFDFKALMDVTGSIDGGGGANAFDFSSGGSGGYTTAVAALIDDANAGSITGNDTFTFANIQSLTGGSGADTFTFDDTSNTPVITSINGGSGSANVLDFGGVNNGAITADVTGASAAGSVSGGATLTGFSNIHTLNGSAAGGDTYTIEPAAYTGAIVINGGAAGNNTLNYPDASTGNGAVFVNLQALNATGVAAFSNITTATIAATDDTYTLTGANSTNDWDVTAANAGDINGGDFTFSGFNVLDGGTGGDSFTVENGITFAGAINGSSGADSLNLLTANQTVTLTSGADSASGFNGSATNVAGGFTNIDLITGTGTTNVLNGENSVGSWDLNVADNDYVTNGHTLAFDASFETLNGGTGGDTFTFEGNFTGTLNGGSGANAFIFDGASVLTGSIVGNTGTDTLDYSSYTGPITLVLTSDSAAGFTGTATGISGTFANIDTLIGTGDPADSLTGENGTAVWTLGTHPYTYTHAAHALTFDNIANLNGGSGADTFNISDDFDGNLNGGTGNDSFVFTALGNVTGNVTGGSTTPGDTLDFSGYSIGVAFLVTSASTTTGASGTVTGIDGTFAGITNLIGVTSGSVTDSLTVNYSPTAYASATWTVSGGASGTNVFADNAGKTFNFSQIENLTGSGNDTFNVTIASHTGNLASPTGTNAFNITSDSTHTVALTGAITGGDGVDTVSITGASAAHPASVSGNIYTGGGGDVVNLVGRVSVGGKINAGDSADGTLSYNGFTTSAVTVNIATGAATAIFGGLATGIADFNTFVGANASGDKIYGPNTANAWDITAANAGNINSAAYNVSQFKNVFGGTASDYFTFEAGAAVVNVNGGAGANTLDFTAYAAGVTVAITGANAGTINTNVVTFSAIASIVGSSNGANTWQFKANGSLSGSISSGSSGDTLTYNAAGGYTRPVTVNLQTTTATLIGGTWANLVTITGSSSTANTLIGSNAGDTFEVTAANAGTDGSVAFTKFQNLTGGTGDDTFTFDTGSSIAGKVNGGAGNNTLDISAENGVEAVLLSTGKATFTGGFLNINSLVGNDNAGTSLTGANVVSTWALSGSDAGVINTTITFSGFAKLIGGSLADTFDFADDSTLVSTSINGGAGSNKMDFSNAGSGGFTADTTVAITANNTGNVNGSFTFTNIQNITGGSGNDSFVFNAGRSVSGAINGGTGRNTLDYTAYTTAVTVNLGTHAATGVTGGATNIQDVLGSLTARNTLTGDGGNDLLVGGAAVDTLKASASGSTTGHSILIGGGGRDAITGDNGYDILIGGATTLDQATLDDIAVNYLAGVNSGATLATQKAAIETADSLSASVTSTGGCTITNGTAGNDWGILNVITTLRNLKTNDIRSFV